jgi:hypothetical protein
MCRSHQGTTIFDNLWIVNERTNTKTFLTCEPLNFFDIPSKPFGHTCLMFFLSKILLCHDRECLYVEQPKDLGPSNHCQIPMFSTI